MIIINVLTVLMVVHPVHYIMPMILDYKSTVHIPISVVLVNYNYN